MKVLSIVATLAGLASAVYAVTVTYYEDNCGSLVSGTQQVASGTCSALAPGGTAYNAKASGGSATFYQGSGCTGQSLAAADGQCVGIGDGYYASVKGN